MTEHHDDAIANIPDRLPDKDGHISLFLMGTAILLLLLLIISIALAM